METNIQANAWHDILQSISERLSRGESYSRIATLLNVGTATVHGWINGRVRGERIGFDRMQRYAEKLGIDIQRHLGGERGNCCFKQVPRVEPILDESGGLRLVDQAGECLAFHHEFLSGLGVEPDAAFLLMVVGNAMAPLLPDGALALISTNAGDLRPVSGQLVAVRLGNEIMIKRFENMGDHVLLQSLNENYTHRELPHTGGDWAVLGLVKWVSHKF